MSDRYETILYELKDNVGIVTLNRPKVNNAENKQMAAELEKVMGICAEDPNVRAVLIQANGRNFQSGGDVEDFAGASPEFMLEFNGKVIETWKLMWRMRKPILGAVQGFCVMDFTNAFDLIMAADNANFANPEVGLGISPGAGISQYLVRMVGIRKAKQLLMFSDRITAWEALHLGIVNWVVPADKLHEEAFKTARKLAQGATLALGAIKMTINIGGEMPLNEGLLYQQMEQLPLFRSEDQREAMQAFLEKRSPEYKGR
jgi:enoyl-CoA hydratase/carnithine racemase